MKATLCLFGVIALAFCPSPRAIAQEPPAPAQRPTMAGISGKMTDVADDLAKTVTGAPVQTQQKVIVRDLDSLIAELEKKAQAARGGIKRNKPTRGMQDSMISRGTGGIGDLIDPRQSQKDWAKLAPRERDRILQSMAEGFPSEYRTVLERYYRRLAEEKSAPAGGKAEPPKPDKP
ncbi:MAG TPA: hypothetical protein VFF52_04615 [Isosphaeraceae bacterium]|nr:hypothetical protein [Isosphaeraceae bacterium]